MASISHALDTQALEHPSYLHDKHWDFPLAPYKRIVRDEEVSDYRKRVLGGEKHSDRKLVADLKDRVKQTYNAEYLQCLLSKVSS